ncbi:class I SAM-dependent methyltransferase [Tetragenococcus osmophilus]|uniref:Class I SAM-dependent methyltransferase n=1 Tax=Tetragenococcus osmophilus TaxID=526944 RepID=A0AA38CXS0_9ENTE|nr:class I SAM-dependent methyltransferase [Tetragenococcus osmophilus]AYW47504.1 class I SAM-dependent methyltransferase [Tetragenococcus osmophilus]GMA53112.1 site-specific DNA-methyltransferase (adenine-specific) [Alicyclobacillus contaminans]GMA72911.1 site-specific DNA-methyltransferase (adenine-specific) [Tetragenococcus osmophilus]
MSAENIEESFQLQLEAIQLLQNALDTSYLDAYIENIENMNDNYQVRIVNDVPKKSTVEEIQRIYQKLQGVSLEKEERRKVSQLLLLKGMQTEPLQPNHQLTPDSIGFLFVFLLEQLYPQKDSLKTVADLACGMGNLLFTVLTNLEDAGYSLQGYGVDNDETMLAVSASNSQWIPADVKLFHQDATTDLLMDPIDAVLSDLPVGYYPMDENAQNFETAAKGTHSFAHHLLIEQSMKYVKENGFGLFLVPTNFLETEQSEELKQWLVDKVYLQGIIQLPDELFKNKAASKSILILQQKGDKAQQVPEVLLAKVASLKEPEKVTAFFNEFKEWQSANLAE